jgi:hypothetical protein
LTINKAALNTKTMFLSKQRSFVGTMGGELKPMDYETDSEEEIDVHENGIDNDTSSSRYSTYVCRC